MSNIKNDNLTYTNFRNNDPARKGASNTNTYFTIITKTNTIFNKLPNKTSSGTDNIPSIISKHPTEKFITAYTIIFNNALNHYYFPSSWKVAQVIPLPKKSK